MLDMSDDALKNLPRPVAAPIAPPMAANVPPIAPKAAPMAAPRLVLADAPAAAPIFLRRELANVPKALVIASSTASLMESISGFLLVDAGGIVDPTMRDGVSLATLLYAEAAALNI